MDWLNDMPPELWDKLDLGLQLGSGLTARVVAARRRTDGRHVALKIIDKRTLGSKALELTRQEANVLSRVQHENIVNLLGCYETEEFLYLELERCEGGELLQAITRQHHYSEATAREVAVRIASALAHLHSLGVLHRDLKPENILLVSSNDRTDVKLADFGLAKDFKAEFAAGSGAAFASGMAPEGLSAGADASATEAAAGLARSGTNSCPVRRLARPGITATSNMPKAISLVAALEPEARGAEPDPGGTEDGEDGFQPGQWPEAEPSAAPSDAEPRGRPPAAGLGGTAWEEALLQGAASSQQSVAAASTTAASSRGMPGHLGPGVAAAQSAPLAAASMRTLLLSPRLDLSLPQGRDGVRHSASLAAGVGAAAAAPGSATGLPAPPAGRGTRPQRAPSTSTAQRGSLGRAAPPLAELPPVLPGALCAGATASPTATPPARAFAPPAQPPLAAGPPSPPPTLLKTSTVCGSARYIAPEVEAGRPYGHKADWYSFGVFLHALLVGEFPPVTVYGQAGPPALGAPAWSDVSPEAKAAVSRLLHPDPELRDGGGDFLSSDWVCGAPARTARLTRAQSSLADFAGVALP